MIQQSLHRFKTPYVLLIKSHGVSRRVTGTSRNGSHAQSRIRLRMSRPGRRVRQDSSTASGSSLPIKPESFSPGTTHAPAFRVKYRPTSRSPLAGQPQVKASGRGILGLWRAGRGWAPERPRQPSAPRWSCQPPPHHNPPPTAPPSIDIPGPTQIACLYRCIDKCMWLFSLGGRSGSCSLVGNRGSRRADDAGPTKGMAWRMPRAVGHGECVPGDTRGARAASKASAES